MRSGQKQSLYPQFIRFLYFASEWGKTRWVSVTLVLSCLFHGHWWPFCASSGSGELYYFPLLIDSLQGSRKAEGREKDFYLFYFLPLKNEINNLKHAHAQIWLLTSMFSSRVAQKCICNELNCTVTTAPKLI